VISKAQAKAARVRAESERELSAATHRRDSINAQLANVRQMLATLSGTSPAALAELTDVVDSQAPGADAELTDPAEGDLEVADESVDAETDLEVADAEPGAAKPADRRGVAGQQVEAAAGTASR
jgi:hypothetical protein